MPVSKCQSWLASLPTHILEGSVIHTTPQGIWSQMPLSTTALVPLPAFVFRASRTPTSGCFEAAQGERADPM